MKFPATRTFPRRPAVCAAVCAATMAWANVVRAQTYYVNALTGSDSNSGLAPGQAWQSLTNVDDTNFAPGASILFAAGQNWYGTLTATTSGTAVNPITYGAYGAGTNPTIWGSDPVVASAFTGYDNVSGDETYTYSTATTVNSFLVNHQFTHSASLVSGQTTDAANVTYVEDNPNTWYYDSTNGGTLYVNPGSPISSSNTYTVAVRQSVINNNGNSNIVFTNLNTAETAAYNGGYGYTILGGSNVTVENASVTGAGKHGVGALDTTNFLGKNISASNFMPDQGYGGSTAFVAFSDYNVTAPTTSTWINDSFTQPNGNYPAFITHSVTSTSVPSPIGSVVVQNMTTDSSVAMAIYTNPNEQVIIQGGTMTGALQLNGNNIMVNGVTMIGQYAQIAANGNNNIVQNSIITGSQPSWGAGFPGALVDNGSNNIFRFNTVTLSNSTGGGGPVIGLLNPDSGSQIYGNIFTTPYSAVLEGVQGAQTAQFFNNLFFVSSGSEYGIAVPAVINENSPSSVPLTSETDFSNLYAIYTDPLFVDGADGNYYLMAGSPALYAFDPTTDEYVPYDIYGDPRAMGFTDLGAVVPEPATLTLMGAVAFLPALRRFRPSRGKS